MKSQMQRILRSWSEVAQAEAPELQAIIEMEEAACRVRIYTRIRPLLLKEFKRVYRRYKVEKVLFGNGTCAIIFNKQSKLAEGNWEDKWPKGLRKLAAMCDSIASTYPSDDITSENV